MTFFTQISEHVRVPPINSIIHYVKSLPPYDIDHNIHEPIRNHVLKETKLPTDWNWYEHHPDDDEQIQKKKSNITLPKDQESCGSCWAVSIASMINDMFVVKGMNNPHISPTHILACYPQRQCNGGNASVVLHKISVHGVGTTDCMDYSWCETNDECMGRNKLSHTSGHTERMNKLIPSCRDCKTLYKISPPHILHYNPQEDIDL